MATLPLPRALVERVYARGVYPVLRQLITGVSSQTTVVLFDWLLIGGVAGVLVWWLSGFLRSARRGRLRALASLTGRMLVVTAALYLVFLTSWGLNYRRQPLATKLGYSKSRVTAVELDELAALAVAHLNRLYDATETETWPQLADLPGTLGPAFERVQQRLGVIHITGGLVPRRSVLTPYFRRAGIDGMVDPFFLQILVNDTVLPFERPFVTAHEWAHVAGFAHEGEANFVAWLTCLEGDDSMQYSGWLYLVGRLLAAVPDASRRPLADRLGPGPQSDYAAVRARLNRVVPVVQRNARRINDRYLRANRVASGVESYAEVVQLVVGTDLGRVHWPSAAPAMPPN